MLTPERLAETFGIEAEVAVVDAEYVITIDGAPRKLTNDGIRHNCRTLHLHRVRRPEPDDPLAASSRRRSASSATFGYQKTTVADIAKALKMSPANVYRFFDSKKAINEAVAERLMREVEDAIDAIAAAPGPAAERLRAMIADHAPHERLALHRRPAHARDGGAALSESWEVVHGHIERKGEIFERVVREGIEIGRVRAVRSGPRRRAACRSR